MKRKMSSKLLLSMFLLGMLGYACIDERLENIDDIDTSVDLTYGADVPLIKGKFKLEDVLEEEENLKYIGGDNVLTIVHREDSIVSFEVSDLIEISDPTPIGKTFDFTPIIINEGPIEGGFKLSEFATALGGSIPTTGNPWPVSTYGPSDLNLTSENSIKFNDFASANFESGKIVMALTNNMPFDIVSLNVEIIAGASSEVIHTFSFANVNRGNSDSQEWNLANKNIPASSLSFKIRQIEWNNGANPYDLNTNELAISIDLQNLKVSYGEILIDSPQSEKNTDVYDLPVDGDQILSELKFKEGTDMTYLEYELRIPDNTRVPMYIKVSTSAIKTPLNADFSEEIKINYDPNAQSSGIYRIYTGKFDLSGHSVVLNDPDPLKKNKVSFDYEVRFESSSTPVMIDFQNSITVNIQLGGINNWEYIKGKFGTEQLAFDPETQDLGNTDFMDNLEGTLTLADPKIYLHYENSIGASVGLDMTITGKKEGETDKQLILTKDNFGVDRPTLVSDPIKIDTIKISNDALPGTSPVSDFIGMIPSEIIFGGTGYLNNGDASLDNFIKHDSRIKFDLEIDMPLNFKINNLSYSDTVEIDGFDDIDLIEVKLGGTATNTFPFKIWLDLVLLDANNKPLAEEKNVVLMKQNGANIDASGKVNPVKEPIDATLGKEFLAQFSKAENVIIKAHIEIPDDKAGFVSKDSYFEYDMRFIGTVNYTSDDN